MLQNSTKCLENVGGTLGECTGNDWRMSEKCLENEGEIPGECSRIPKELTEIDMRMIGKYSGNAWGMPFLQISSNQEDLRSEGKVFEPLT